MDPLTLILSAILAGAAAAAKPTAEQVVKDAYAGLKTVIESLWKRVDLRTIEQDPASKSRQAVLREDLEKVGNVAEPQVLAQARKVVEVVAKADPEAARAAGILIEDLDAGASVTIENTVSEEGGVTVRRVKAVQDIRITGTSSGKTPAR
jgi:hypothetical protein